MEIRHVQITDWERISQIETSNFSPEEAAKPEVIRKRIETIADTFLVATFDEQIAGYIEGPVITERYISDDLFHDVSPNPTEKGFIAITSLSIAKEYQGQAIGTTLLAALKDLAVAQNRQGITLTCHDYLISYYEMNGFSDEGESLSQHGGAKWFNLVWENPEFEC